MHFALLGDHEDGLAMARALAESGRHHLRCYSGPAVGAEYLRRWNLSPAIVADVEEVLADPAVEVVIVAVPLATRPTLLRRALQAEHHVLCVHPADHRPDSAYEASSIQRETRCVLLPLLPEASHPGLERLATLIRQERGTPEKKADELPPLVPRLIQLERWCTEAVLHDSGSNGRNPGLPGWEILRALAGEIVEVSAFAHSEEVRAEEPILLAGRFEWGGLFQTVFLPHQPQSFLRVSVTLRYDQAELLFPEGWPGPARLTWTDETGQKRQESWDTLDPWQHLVETFEASLAFRHRQKPSADKRPAPERNPAGLLSWEDEIRCLELDDAARRSIERRRSSTLEYQEAYEEASFKGTMTLAGCGLLWVSLLLLILSIWVPLLGWVIAPLFGIFLVMQLLRWVIPPRGGGG